MAVPQGLRVTLVLGVAALVPGICTAALYRCIDASGATVFTDTPAQLRECVKMDASPGILPTPQAPARPVPPPAPTPPPITEDPPHPGEAAIPVQRAGNLWIVTAKLNGIREARMILDTGASHTVLSQSVARDLGVLPMAGTTPVTVKTAGGPVQADIVTVPSIQVGEVEAQNVVAGVFDIPDVPAGVEGLLGLTFLNQFRVTLDAAKGELHLNARKP